MGFIDLVKQARTEKRTLLSEIESKNILSEAGVNITETFLTLSTEEAIAKATDIGYPVALKIVASGISHKSDVGGVMLNLQNNEEVVNAYDSILNNVQNTHPDAKIEGVSVQKMAESGTEVIIGMTLDQQFGPVIMFGLGGVLVEVLNDVSFRLAPLEENDAIEMIDEIAARPILDGVRGEKPCNLSELHKMLLQISVLVTEYPEIKEVDLNPVIASSKGAVAVDARIILNDDLVERKTA
ncbi:uncharacterized protein METZ01_LOCUS338278 [marine metagenome]|uniref:ATP-grasp domain-containing protein n=1 Tax=marine metagenome TaxID=408172 RepID=A0A382QIR6_9ZZZZ